MGALCGYCEGSFRRDSSICPDAHRVAERFPEGEQHNKPEPRRAYCSVHTREPTARAHLVTSCVYGIFFVSRQRCWDSFHPRVLIVQTVAPCVRNVVALHGSRRLKWVSASSAHKPCEQRQQQQHQQQQGVCAQACPFFCGVFSRRTLAVGLHD